MAFWCLILFLTLLEVSIHVVSQTGAAGFISIDCGITSRTTYKNSYSGLPYVSDDQYIDSGVNYKIPSQYSLSGQYKDLGTLRSFPGGTKNCYTLNSLTKGSKYLIKAFFLYANYDSKNSAPTFDLYLGVNIWATVNPILPTYYYHFEIIAIATADYVQVCLVNTGQGTPFISSLELRPLSKTQYPQSNETQSLVLVGGRCDFGSNTKLTRFPDDRYDRMWRNCSEGSFSSISTVSTVQNLKNDIFEIPSVVMQTAIIGNALSPSIDIDFQGKSLIGFTSLIVLHLSEIQKLSSTNVRAFDVFVNENKLTRQPFMPTYLYSDALYNEQYGERFNVSLRRSASSTLPPILNAIEVYMIQPVTLVPTESVDVTTINAIKTTYHVDKGWNGDPCVPSTLTWSGLNCSSSSSSSAPRITTLKLSSFGLTGPIVSQFGNLNALKYLDLSKNKLSGSIPTFLDNLTALTYLDLSGNDLVGSIPPGLQQRESQGLLTDPSSS